MTRHILILGNNLTKFITAYRLLSYGFHLTIVDTPSTVQPGVSSRTSTDFNHSPASLALPEQWEPPLILHGFYHATWALFQELSLDCRPHTSQSVSLEFASEGNVPVTLPQSSRMKWLHPRTRWSFFQGLSWSDRWHFINFLEKQWEDNTLPNHHPDSQTIETWLISAKQSAHSRSHFWNPLCRLFLNCNVQEASLDSFVEILSQYWFGKPTDAATYLATSATLGNLETRLRQLLIKKGAKILPANTKIVIQSDANGITSVVVDQKHIHADTYISTLPPHDLLPLLPERALARYTYFSSLAHIPEVYGLAIRFTLQSSLISSRLILHPDPFDWITSQRELESQPSTTIVTCYTLCKSMAQAHSEPWLIHTAWALIQKLFNLSSTYTQESCEPHIFRQSSPFSPCYRGTRTYRPLPQTPIPNLFLAGPWAAINLPTSLESHIKSANTCAEAVASAFQAKTH